MIHTVKLRMSAALPAFSSLLCGLLVGGCSSGQTEAQRLASERIRREPYQSSDAPLEARPGSSNRMLQTPIQPASVSEIRLAQQTIRAHLHAFGKSDFHEAYSLLTPEFQQSTGDAERLRGLITSTYSDFMHVKKVDWQAFAKDTRSGDLRVLLIFEASGGITRVTYFLHLQDKRYLINGIRSNPSFTFNRKPGSPPSRQDQLEERMFSGVLFSPMPRHRVLDSAAASL